jgi:single-stranded DNA-specific DHH superfamily exonuclease
MTSNLCVLKQGIKVRENHANARKIFRLTAVSGHDRRARLTDFEAKWRKFIDRMGRAQVA